MAASNAGTTCLVVCADSNIFDLLVGLLLSLRGRDRSRYVVGLIDVGLDQPQRDYLRDLCDGIEPVRSEWLVPLSDGIRQKIEGQSPFWRAQACRPFLPEYFPGHHHYVHLDADMWVQGFGFLDAARGFMDAGKMVIVPESDATYPHLFSWEASERYAADKAVLTAQILGETVARQTAAMPYLNTGFFGLHRDAPHWAVFKDWLGRVFARGYHHLSEQMTLNAVIYHLADRVQTMPAVCNWLCSYATPVRDEQGRWCSPGYPRQPIDLLHLTGTNKVARYKPLGLLYDGGAYLPGIAHLCRAA